VEKGKDKGAQTTMRLTTVNAKSISSSDHAHDDYRAKIEEAIKSDPKTFFGYVGVCILKVVWPLAPRKSVICLRILFNEHIPMMSGCLLILAQNTCQMIHLLARFSSLQMWSRVFCRIWMLTRVPAPMAYHRSF
jgi:hypothetical protein